ncbi:MAG TPA: hypothetical protein VFS09_07595 [Candidatus Eisenbacteria bacterium]|nr:hypothetical protein [Candidatus Eisenbacteria bacterium]
MNAPRRRSARWAALLVGVAAFLAAAASVAQVVVPTKDPQHPRIRYQDSLLSLNDRCIVRGGTLNPIFRPVYVNGRPIGFC